jgi:hypothetical protein
MHKRTSAPNAQTTHTMSILKAKRFMLYSEVIVVRGENRIEHIITLSQNVELPNLTTDGLHNYRLALNG